MPFFKSKPTIATNEKSRIEFELQQLLDCVGAQRFQLPVVRLAQWNTLLAGDLGDVVRFVGERISHETGALNVVVRPENLATCGGGG